MKFMILSKMIMAIMLKFDVLSKIIEYSRDVISEHTVSLLKY